MSIWEDSGMIKKIKGKVSRPSSLLKGDGKSGEIMAEGYCKGHKIRGKDFP